MAETISSSRGREQFIVSVGLVNNNWDGFGSVVPWCGLVVCTCSAGSVTLTLGTWMFRSTGNSQSRGEQSHRVGDHNIRRKSEAVFEHRAHKKCTLSLPSSVRQARRSSGRHQSVDSKPQFSACRRLWCSGLPVSLGGAPCAVLPLCLPCAVLLCASFSAFLLCPVGPSCAQLQAER